MRLRKWLLILFSLGLAVALTVMIVAIVRGDRAPPKQIGGSRIDSVDVHYSLWDSKEKRKKLEVWADESRRNDDGRIQLQRIRGTIFKKGQMTEDVEVSAVIGIATPDYNDFVLQEQATVVSRRLDLRSEFFHMRQMLEVTTDRPTEYSFETMKGKAAGGIDFYFREKDMRFRSNEGSFLAGGEEYSHRENRCFLVHQELKLVLEEVDYFRSADSHLASDRLYLEFTPGFAALKYSLAIDNVSLKRDFTRSGRPGEALDLVCFSVESFYNEAGRVDHAVVKGGAERAKLDLVKKGRRTVVRAGSMNLGYEVENGRLKTIEAGNSVIDAAWRDSFRFEAQKTFLTLNKAGDIESIQGEIGCTLNWKKHLVTSNTADYNGEKGQFILRGEPCELNRGKDRFISSSFRIATRERILATESGIQATITPSAAQQSFLRKRPVFIVAREMVLDERQNRVRFSGEVRMFQEDTELLCQNLDWSVRGDQFELRAWGDAILTGKTAEGRAYTLRGEEVVFFSQQNRLSARKGVLQSGEESMNAAEVSLLFRAERSLESIRGRGQARFQSREAQGEADEVDWNWDQSLLHLSGNARISIKGMNTARDQLTVNLKNNEIVGNPRRRELP